MPTPVLMQPAPAPADLAVVRVDVDFKDEYPDGDTTCTEAYASLCRTGEALLGELDRRIALTFDMPQAAATALAVIGGAGTLLTPRRSATSCSPASATSSGASCPPLPKTNEHTSWTCSPKSLPDQPRSPINDPNPSMASASGPPDSPSPAKPPDPADLPRDSLRRTRSNGPTNSTIAAIPR